LLLNISNNRYHYCCIRSLVR